MFNFKNPPKKSPKGKEEIKTLHLSFGGKTYAVPTAYKTVKHMRMHVHRDGALTLSVPLGTKQKDIERFCREKEQRILGHLQSITARPVAYASLPVKDGDSFPCFGETLLVAVEKGNRAEVRREGKRLQLTLRNPENGDAVNRLFAKWQKETTKAYMTYLCQCEFPYFKSRGVAFPRIEVRAFSGKWGTCYYTEGRIVFTTALMYTSPDHARYVALHELSHFLVHDHSAAFYRLIEERMPGWKSYKAKASVLQARPKS